MGPTHDNSAVPQLNPSVLRPSLSIRPFSRRQRTAVSVAAAMASLMSTGSAAAPAAAARRPSGPRRHASSTNAATAAAAGAAGAPAFLRSHQCWPASAGRPPLAPPARCSPPAAE
eukprot:364137-Chlamydomonas_euryale.AAC.3